MTPLGGDISMRDVGICMHAMIQWSSITLGCDEQLIMQPVRSVECCTVTSVSSYTHFLISMRITKCHLPRFFLHLP
jgi:hypothetical protein